MWWVASQLPLDSAVCVAGKLSHFSELGHVGFDISKLLTTVVWLCTKRARDEDNDVTKTDEDRTAFNDDGNLDGEDRNLLNDDRDVVNKTQIYTMMSQMFL